MDFGSNDNLFWIPHEVNVYAVIWNWTILIAKLESSGCPCTMILTDLNTHEIN